MLELGGPGHVADVDEAVDAVFDADEDAEVGDVADLADNLRANRVALLEERPGVGLELLHAERNLLGVGVNLEHHALNDIALLDHLGGVLDPLRPGHLRDVDEALDALLELDEGAVVDHGDNLAEHLHVGGVAVLCARPGVGLQLLEAERDALALAVELEDLDAELVANADDLFRVGDAAPAHVGDVKEAVDATQVDEGAVLGDVLDDTIEDGAFDEALERLPLLALALVLEEGATRQDDVAPLLVELDDLELEGLADELVEVPRGAEFDLAAREEGLDADVDLQAALDATNDEAEHELVALHLAGDLFPHLHAVGFALAEAALAVVVFERDNKDLNLVANGEGDGAVESAELAEVNATFRLSADVDECLVILDREDDTLGDFAFARARGLGLEQQLTEAQRILILLLLREETTLLNSLVHAHVKLVLLLADEHFPECSLQFARDQPTESRHPRASLHHGERSASRRVRSSRRPPQLRPEGARR